MTVVLFEDEQVSQLDPITLGRPAFAITCGGYRLVDLVAELANDVRVSVRPHLGALTQADFGQLRLLDEVPAGLILGVNSRLVPSTDALAHLRRLLKAARPGQVCSGGAQAAFVIPRSETIAANKQEATAKQEVAAGGMAALCSHAAGLETVAADLPLFEYPHDVVRYHPLIFRANLERRIKEGGYQDIGDGLFAAPGATLGPYCVTDTRHGPIVLDEGAAVGPYCYLSGPLHVGRSARVLEHAALKDGVSLGHTTKVGGEVEASIIEPYTNKQHHGFLGHSYLGSWVNLGAGTCNSDLKNTYGQVNMEYRGKKVPTDMQFVGTIVGDYAKTAINTGIFTGKTIGVCSMVYGFVTTNVPSFVNYARLFGQVTEAPVEVMVSTQKRMFARRGVEQRPCDVQLLTDMYRLTEHERHLPGKPMSLEPLSL